MYDRIKKDLPRFPDDVIRQWLLPIAEGGYGWPPPTDGLGDWRYALGRKSLDYWQKGEWSQEILALAFEDFEPFSKMSIKGLFDAHVAGAQNAYSSIVNGRARFYRLVEHIRTHGNLPVVPIVKRQSNGIELIDGNHRIAALTAVRWMWTQEKMRAELIERGLSLPAMTHLAWVFRPPQEGDYIPDPVTAQQDRQAAQYRERQR